MTNRYAGINAITGAQSTATNYAKLSEQIGKRPTKKLGNNTYARRDGDSITIKYHNTDIITVAPNGDASLFAGQWQTLTTKERFNSYLRPLGLSIYSDRKVWKVYKARQVVSLFYDGITIDAEGNVKEPRDPAQYEAQNKILLKRINKYVKGFEQAAKDGHIPVPPTNGDCWFCLLTANDGQPLGDISANHEHLFSHIEEGYYVPSLLWNVVKSRNYGDPALVYNMAAQGDFRILGRSMHEYLYTRLRGE